jgi:hypothetical protein
MFNDQQAITLSDSSLRVLRLLDGLWMCLEALWTS